MGETPRNEQPAAEASAADALARGWARIKDHRVIQWGLAYLAAALALAHGQELMAHAFGWGEIVGRVVMALLVLGLPLALTLAWYHGQRGARHVSGAEAMIIAILLLIGAGLLVIFVRAGGPTEPIVAHAPAAATGKQASTQPPLATATEGGVSLAVLPFADMSPEGNQEYFSDGLSEELLNQLAQIKGLRVAGRTSSFAFKGKNEDLRVIGEKLGVNHLLEGSVRKSGTRLRITAQLINAADGSHLWSESYDRKLDDVFKVQEDIAKDVASALSITLGVGETARPQGGTSNVTAYDKYLRARELYYQLGRSELERATALYRQAVGLDPNFGLAWYGLYLTLVQALAYFPENTSTIVQEIGEASGQVLALAPTAWWTNAMRTDELASQRQWDAALAAGAAASASAPSSETDADVAYALALASVGQTRTAVEYIQRARRADPLSLAVSGFLQLVLDASGRRDEAQAEYERSKDLAGDHGRWEWFALLRMWSRGNADPTAIEAQFREYVAHETFPMSINRALEGKLQDKPAALAAIRQAFEEPANQDITRLTVLALWADHYGDKDLALKALRRQFIELNSPQAGVLWWPWETGLRADPRFKEIVRNLKLVDYWRQGGNWGDHCRPVGADDFECR